jgi:hypothetical protein
VLSRVQANVLSRGAGATTLPAVAVSAGVQDSPAV